MATVARFPHEYSVSLVDRALCAPPRQAIAAGAPPQFGGTDTVWSPEELLVGAALECLWTTYEAYARAEKLETHKFTGTGKGILEKGPSGPTFTSIRLSVELIVDAADIERAERLIVTAEKHCIISNALRAPVTVEATVHAK